MPWRSGARRSRRKHHDPAYCHPHYVYVLPPEVEASLDALVDTTIEHTKNLFCGEKPPP